MERKEFEDWFWKNVVSGNIPSYEVDTAIKAWQAARARINWQMNELSITNNLPHWRCISKKSNKWWVRNDGLEATLHHGESIWLQLENIDKDIPMHKEPTADELAANLNAIAKAFGHEGK